MSKSVIFCYARAANTCDPAGVNRYRCFATLLLAFACTLLVSCIEGREEIWLNANGSGRADLSYDIPATAARLQGGAAGVKELLDSLLVNAPAHTSEVSIEGDRLKVKVQLAFESPGELTRLTSNVSTRKTPSAFKHLSGIFTVDRSWRTIDFTRVISPGKALPAALIPDSQFRDRKLTYILHLPLVPEESTATRTEDGGRTLIWEQPLANAVREPIVIHFKGKIPIPPWLTAIAVILCAVAAIFGLKGIQKLRRGSGIPA